MVYGIIQLINFAHGELFTAGSFIGLIVLGALQSQGFVETHFVLSLILIFLLAMAYVAVLGVAMEHVAYKPLRRAPRISALLSALGMSIFLSNGMMLAQGVSDRAYPPVLGTAGFDVLGARVTFGQVFIVLLSVALLVALNLFVKRTRLGKAMRATAQNRKMASLVGIDIDKTIRTTFIIGPALGAAAGVMVGMYYGSVRFDMGFLPAIKAFAAAVLGGIGNITGAVLGAFLIAAVEVLWTAFLPSEWKDVTTFVVLILVLYLRPTGIMGERVTEERV
jgi:branched-chain amino acid transport system permease protein